jgi:hypothetical protein
MKTILFSIAILLTPMLIQAQTVSINEFYRKYKHADEKKAAVVLPGWLLRMGVGIAKNKVEEDLEKDILRLAGKIGKLRVLAFEDANPVRKKDFDRLMKGLRRERFEDLVMVRSEGTNVNIMLRERKEKVRNLLIMVNEEDAFTLVSLKMKVKLEDIQDIINRAMEEDEKGKRGEYKL